MDRVSRLGLSSSSFCLSPLIISLHRRRHACVGDAAVLASLQWSHFSKFISLGLRKRVCVYLPNVFSRVLVCTALIIVRLDDPFAVILFTFCDGHYERGVE